MQQGLFSRRPVQFGILVFLGAIWGGSFILIKKALLTFSPLQIGALRVGIAAVILLPVTVWGFREMKKARWYWFFLTGLLGNALPAFLFSWAQTGISSSLSGFTNSLTPLFTLLIGAMLFQQAFAAEKTAGVLLGLLGAGMLIFSGADNAEVKSLWYFLPALGGALCYGFSVNIIKTKLQAIHPLVVTSWAFAWMLPLSLIVFALDGYGFQVQWGEPVFLESVLSVLFLGAVGTAFAVWIFNMLIKHTTALFASSTTYIIPVFALLWGLADHEAVLPLQIAGIGAILSGVYISGRSG